MARQHKIPFVSSSIHSIIPFQLVHIDIWGSYHIRTYNGFRYFLTLIDDYSRVTSTHFESGKINDLPVLIAFVFMVKVHFSSNVHKFRSDNTFELEGEGEY